MIKTSDTDPLQVAFVPPGHIPFPGRLGMTFAPGKTGHFSMGEMRRDLAMDLRRLRNDFHTDVLVVTVEDHELTQFKIEALVPAAQAAGIHVVRFPVRDAGTPPDMPAFVGLIEGILAHLAVGRDVVVTCRGGLGRTGLVAASVLVAAGMTPQSAIALVRRTRSPQAVETAAQEAYVEMFAEAWAGRALPVAKTSRDGLTSDAEWLTASQLAELPRDRFRACLLGGAIGDALGNPIEFLSLEAIRHRFPEGYPQALASFRHGLVPFTDDTQMTLFTAEGLIRAVHQAKDGGPMALGPAMLDAYRRWYATQDRAALPVWGDQTTRGWLLDQTGLHSQQAPGMTCLSALRDAKLVATNDSKGCGAVMRVAPIGLAAASRDDAFEGAAVAGGITHGHPSGYLSAGYFASLIYDVARGMSLPEAMVAADSVLVGYAGAEEMQQILAKARVVAANGKPCPEDLETLGGGWVGEEALAIALVCALTADLRSSEGVAAALWRSVCHGGDSDSTGAICGNLLGAMGGLAVLPAELMRSVSLLVLVDRVAIDLHATAIRGVELDQKDYPAG